MSFLIPDPETPPKKAFVTFSPGPIEILSLLMLLAVIFIWSRAAIHSCAA
jgi:hypothetical protein